MSFFLHRVILSLEYHSFFDMLFFLNRIIRSSTCFSFFVLSYFLWFVIFSSTCNFSPAYHSSYICCFFYYTSIILSSSHTTLYVISSLSNKIQKNNLCINYQQTYCHIISSHFFILIQYQILFFYSCRINQS